MAKWQTDWAHKWADYGYRRGIHSTRQPLANKWVQGKIAEVARLAEDSRQRILDGLRSNLVTPEILAAASVHQALEAIQARLIDTVWPEIQAHTEALAELANRSHQFDGRAPGACEPWG